MKELIKHVVILALLGSSHYTVLLTISTSQVIVIPILRWKKTKTKQHNKKTTPKPAMIEEHKKKICIK